MPTPVLEALLVQAGDLIDVIKVGWGIGWVCNNNGVSPWPGSLALCADGEDRQR
jgi:phosphosulfolactate synthase (CoM biosynthesis protein A)